MNKAMQGEAWINLHRLESLNPDTEEPFSGPERFFSRSK